MFSPSPFSLSAPTYPQISSIRLFEHHISTNLTEQTLEEPIHYYYYYYYHHQHVNLLRQDSHQLPLQPIRP